MFNVKKLLNRIQKLQIWHDSFYFMRITIKIFVKQHVDNDNFDLGRKQEKSFHI